MDIHLQGAMDGIAVAEEIRRRFRLPVIFLTAYSEDITLDRAKLAEPLGYILKPFNDRELKSTIEIGLYKHRAEEEIRRLNRLYDVLSQVNQAIVRVQSREELLQSVCRIIVERGAADLAWIGWLDRDTSRIDPVAVFGKRTDLLLGSTFYADDRPEGQGNPGKAIREGTAFACDECGANTCCYPPTHTPARFGFRSCGSFPLRFQGELCGALTIFTTEPGFFREREMELLKEVSTDVSSAIDKIADHLLRRQTQEALAYSNERLALALAASRMGVWEWNIETNEVFWSPECYDIIGMKHPDPTLESFTSLIHPEDAGRVMDEANRAIVEKGAYTSEFRVVRPGGKVRWLSNYGQATYGEDGVPLRLTGTVLDITDKKQAEEALRQSQKLEEIGRLAGGVAHDFNNILTVISGYGDILRANLSCDDSLAEYVDQILSSAAKAANLTQNLLAFSRKQPIRPNLCDLNGVVKRSKEFLSRIIGEDIEVETNLWASPLVVMADQNQLDRVLVNIAANARDAMPEGGILSISTSEFTIEDTFIREHGYGEVGSYAAVSISDSGIGMDEDTLGKIFDPFFTTKEIGKGTGLGLSMVYGIVKQHNGYVLARSELRKGTIFTVLLPKTESQSSEESVGEATCILPRGDETILLVEDEENVRKYITLVLSSYGYRVLDACDGKDALNQFARHKDSVALCILDVVMPKMNGKDLLNQLRELKSDIKVLFMSGYSDDILEQKGLSHSKFDITPKPIRVPDFLSDIRRAIDGGRGYDEVFS